MGTIKDFISKCSNKGQCISLYLVDSKENEYYLCATKVYSRIFQYIGDLEVSRWSVDRDGNVAVYVKDKEDGGVENAE